MPGDLIDYDHVAGVSIGAINASIFSTFPPGQEKEAAAKVNNMYETYTSSDLFSFYSPMLLAPFKHNSLANLDPLHDVLNSLLEERPF